MKPQSKAALVKAPQGAIQEIPEHQRPKQTPRGGENVDDTDVIIPRIGLAQGLSDEIVEGNPKFIQGLKPGMYFNNVSKEVYGASLNLMPVFKYTTQALFGPRDQGVNILCQSLDGKTGVGTPGGNCRTCPLNQFGSGKKNEKGEAKGKACTEFKNLAVVVIPKNGTPQLEHAGIFSFKRGSITSAKQLFTKLKMTGKDYFSYILTMTSALKKEPGKNFHIPILDYTRTATPCSDPRHAEWTNAETFKIGEEVYLGMKQLQAQNQLKVEIDDDPEHDAADNTPF